MLRLKSDLLPALLAVAEGRLDGVALDWHDDAALSVVMAAKGYPGAYAKGTEIKGLDAAGARPGCGDLPCRHQRDGDRAPRRWRPRARRHRAGREHSPRRRPAPMRRSTRSTGRAASAAATSAGARWSGLRPGSAAAIHPICLKLLGELSSALKYSQYLGSFAFAAKPSDAIAASVQCVDRGWRACLPLQGEETCVLVLIPALRTCRMICLTSSS